MPMIICTVAPIFVLLLAFLFNLCVLFPEEDRHKVHFVSDHRIKEIVLYVSITHKALVDWLPYCWNKLGACIATLHHFKLKTNTTININILKMLKSNNTILV